MQPVGDSHKTVLQSAICFFAASSQSLATSQLPLSFRPADALSAHGLGQNPSRSFADFQMNLPYPSAGG
jgi:hypothetical protein